MVISLIGYRGSGKSTVARLLAADLKIPWVDSDDLIEDRAARSIREIFEEAGEREFRRLEQDVIRELTRKDPLVIAAGGGAVLAAENRRRMQEAGPVVWLQAGTEQLAERIQQDETTEARRPSLTGQSAAAEIETVLNSRLAQYEDAATITVRTDGLSPEQVVIEIRRQLARTGAFP